MLRERRCEVEPGVSGTMREHLGMLVMLVGDHGEDKMKERL